MADEQPCRTSRLVTVVATIVDQVRIMLRRDNVQPLAAERAVAVEQTGCMRELLAASARGAIAALRKA